MPNEVSASDSTARDRAPRDGATRDGATRDAVAEVCAVEYHYDGGQPVLRGVDFTARGGTVTVLIGANGSGKSTLSRILAGILQPRSGVVRFLGEPMGNRVDRANLSARLGYVSQDAALDPEMTGREILTLFAALHGLRRDRRSQRLVEVVTGLGLESWLDRRVDTLSGGQRRRLHLAAGMIHDPELLCLDEPGVGLDPDGVSLLWNELENRARAGRAVVIVTHDLAAAERYAGIVAILDRGRLVACGPPKELLSEQAPSLREVYQLHTGREPETLGPGGRGRKRGGQERRGQGRGHRKSGHRVNPR